MPTLDVLTWPPDPRIARLAERLGRERAEVPASVLHEWVSHAWSGYRDARVQAFVPILVEREVRARIGSAVDADGDPSPGLSLRAWAWLTARRLLAGELPRRWAHSRGVARRAEQIAPAFSPADQELLVASAWLHDIGYAAPVRDTGMHQLDGARYLARHGVPDRVCALVAHHAGAAAVADLVGLAGPLAAFDDERTAVRDALWYCDMTTGPDGTSMTFAERMAELRRRRTADDPVVRALAVNEEERAAAVRRTEEHLRAALARAS
ncbi:three-helix bundle dimerization domain-containing protein [Actinophytocola sp. KF-1]